MRRRHFLALLGSIVIGFPADVVAQKPERVRRIGVLMPVTAGDAVGLRRAKIFTQALQDLGWTDGQNARIDYRWSGGDIEQIQSLAKELVGSKPDVLVGIGSAPTAALQQATRTIPIVFTMSTDPVAQGIVESLARPCVKLASYTAQHFFWPPMVLFWYYRVCEGRGAKGDRL
jgi:putative tryptophan/tyrosine transport system substrate-binding protein